MLRGIRLIGQLSRREIMLVQSIGDGKGATLIIEDMVGTRLPSKFSQGIITSVGFVIKKLWACIILSPIVSHLIIQGVT